MGLGLTHKRVVPAVREEANSIARRFGVSWNTYVGHGLPPARGEAFTVDFWELGGRGDTLDEHKGDAVVAWVLGQHQVFPVRVLIWWSWWWRPGVGWARYSGFHGNHGPGRDAHVHVGW